MKEYYLDKIENENTPTGLCGILRDLIRSWKKGFINDRDYETIRDNIISMLEGITL